MQSANVSESIEVKYRVSWLFCRSTSVNTSYENCPWILHLKSMTADSKSEWPQGRKEYTGVSWRNDVDACERQFREYRITQQLWPLGARPRIEVNPDRSTRAVFGEEKENRKNIRPICPPPPGESWLEWAPPVASGCAGSSSAAALSPSSSAMSPAGALRLWSASPVTRSSSCCSCEVEPSCTALTRRCESCSVADWLLPLQPANKNKHTGRAPPWFSSLRTRPTYTSNLRLRSLVLPTVPYINITSPHPTVCRTIVLAPFCCLFLTLCLCSLLLH